MGYARTKTGTPNQHITKIHLYILHYGIEWKVAVNNRVIMSKDTEQDLVLEPAAPWEHILEPKLKKALLKKK